MDFGAEIADRSYQEIPTGALRPRNDILVCAFELNDKLKFDVSTDKSTAKRRCFQNLLYDSLYPAYFLTVSSILVLTKAARSTVFRSLYSS